MPTSSDGQASAEIEVTPEMIEAGVCELTGFDGNEDSGSQLVVRIYRAMCLVRSDDP